MLDNRKSLKDYIESSLKNTQATIAQLAKDPALMQQLEQAIGTVVQCFQGTNKVLFAGNGGSAADAQHMSAEFISRFMFDRPGLPSIALTTDTSAITAIGNDYGFELLFARQVQALGQSGDVLIAYSTSGTSPNILRGLEVAKQKNVTTIGLTGMRPESETMAALCDVILRVPSCDTPQIQEGHLVLGHLLCGAVEQQLFGQLKAEQETKEAQMEAS